MTIYEAKKQLTDLLEYFEDRIKLETDPLFNKEEAKKDAEALKIAIETSKQELGNFTSHKWVKGKDPKKNGKYWVTTRNSIARDDIVFYEPLKYENGEWILSRGMRFNKENIIAYMDCVIPEPYRE